MRAQELNEALRANMKGFVAWLYPLAKYRGTKAYLGDVTGAKGDSFVIEVEGPKRGASVDNNPSGDWRGGTPLDLYMAAKGVDFVTALREVGQQAKSWGWYHEPLTPVYRGRPGERVGNLQRVRPVVEAEPLPEPFKRDWEDLDEGSDVWRYLTEERGVTEEALLAWQVGEVTMWFPQDQQEHRAIVFPVFADAAGKDLVGAKYLALDRPEGKKLVKSSKGLTSERHHLIGLAGVSRVQARADSGRFPEGSLFITEGEIDALTLCSYGYPAVSVPFGAKGDDKGNAWVENDWEFLESRGDLYVCMDADGAGKVARDALVQRLGKERCRVVVFRSQLGQLRKAYKDANEAALAEPECLAPSIEAAEAFDPEELKRAWAYREEVAALYFPPSGEEPGVPIPWKANFPFRFRPAELTVHQGYEGHGKTNGLNHLICHFAARGQRTCIASLEVKASKTLRNLHRMVIGRSRPTNQGQPDYDLLDRGLRWLDRYVFLYDKVGIVDHENVMEVFKVCARRYNVKHFVIDSLMKLDVDEEDRDRIRRVIDITQDFAKQFDVHVHFVCHAKKSTEKRREDKGWPDKHDIKGSGTIPAQADNVLCWYRNLAKTFGLEQLELKMQKNPAAEAELQEEYRKLERANDELLIVQKQKETGDLPVLQLWYDGSWGYGSTQYLAAFGEEPVCYLAG